jgi:hypothetical protein
MKRAKTSELAGAALDWAVAKCEGLAPYIVGGLLRPRYRDNERSRATHTLPKYSTDWAEGGPIIERERIHLTAGVNWMAEMFFARAPSVEVKEFGSTPLIAAMRCYVKSKLGNEVEVPGALL